RLAVLPCTAVVRGSLCSVASGGFPARKISPLALGLLSVVGFLELSFTAMAQTLVQLRTPESERGRVIGLYILCALGMRAFSGVTIGIIGGLIGIHWSLALSAIALLAILTTLLALTTRKP